jgi:GT2 family glycosyltransferase
MEFEIVVIDNASFDDCDKMLQQCYPQVRFIQAERNLGFAGANNAAFKMSSGRNILFLNPDTETEGTAIETLHHELDSMPNAGVAGTKLLNSDRSIQTSCIQSFPTILNQLFDSNVLRNLFPRARLWGMKPLFTGDGVPAEVDAVSGACLMIKRAVFESVGMFCTDYFMYSEDIDLCLRVQETGWKAYYVPTAVVVHHAGGSSSKESGNAFSSVMMLESNWRYFKRRRPLWYCWLYRIAMFSASVMRVALVFLAWPILGLQGGRHSPRNTINKWTARLRWTLGLEKWVKNY